MILYSEYDRGYRKEQKTAPTSMALLIPPAAFQTSKRDSPRFSSIILMTITKETQGHHPPLLTHCPYIGAVSSGTPEKKI